MSEREGRPYFEVRFCDGDGTVQAIQRSNINERTGCTFQVPYMRGLFMLRGWTLEPNCEFMNSRIMSSLEPIADGNEEVANDE